MTLTLANLVDRLGGRLCGDPDRVIAGLAPLQSAGHDQISFLSHPKYQHQLTASQAACVIVAPAFEALVRQGRSAIVTDDPYLYFARLKKLFS